MYTLSEVKQRGIRENNIKNKRLHFFASNFSIYFSWIFINLNISANGVTIIFFLTGLLGAISFTFYSYGFVLLGYFLWRMHILFDICDGEVARFTQKFSINGAYWDYMIHSILYPLTFVAISTALFFKFDDVNFLLLGLLGSIVVSQTLAVKNNYYRAMLFNNLTLDKTKGVNTQSKLKFLIFNTATLLLNFEGFLFFHVIFTLLDVSSSIYIGFLIFYIIGFLLQFLVKFYLFSKNGYYNKKS